MPHSPCGGNPASSICIVMWCFHAPRPLSQPDVQHVIDERTSAAQEGDDIGAGSTRATLRAQSPVNASDALGATGACAEQAINQTDMGRAMASFV